MNHVSDYLVFFPPVTKQRNQNEYLRCRYLKYEGNKFPVNRPNIFNIPFKSIEDFYFSVFINTHTTHISKVKTPSMKLNNRKLQVHGIGLNMRETYNWGTPLEVFGDTIIYSSHCEQFSDSILRIESFCSSLLRPVFEQAIFGRKKKVSRFLNFTAEPSRLG